MKLIHNLWAVGFLFAGITLAHADSLDDSIKLTLKCKLYSVPDNYDQGCVRKHIKDFEKVIFNEGSYNKLILAQALWEVYLADGSMDKAADLDARIAVYREVVEVNNLATRDACGCDFDARTMVLSENQQSYVYNQEALFLDQQGEQYHSDAADARKWAKFYAKRAKGPSMFQQIAVAANAGFDAYAATKGVTVAQPQAAQAVLYPSTSSGAVGAGQNAEANQSSRSALPDGNKYVTPTTRGCVRTEYVNASLYFINGCNVAVTDEFTNDSGKTWGQGDLAPGQRSEATAFGIGYNPRTDGMIYTLHVSTG